MPRMIRLSITAAAFDAIAASLPLGSVGFERQAALSRQGLGFARLVLSLAKTVWRHAAALIAGAIRAFT
jgi:hypothetical protein